MENLCACFYPLNSKFNFENFPSIDNLDILIVQSLQQIETLSKCHIVLCIVIIHHVEGEEDVRKIENIRKIFPKIPCIVYGNIDNCKLSFSLAKIGVKNIIPFGGIQDLCAMLHQLKAENAFYINLNNFGIELNSCSFWTQKYINFILKEYNFLNYDCVNTIAKEIGTSSANLNMTFKKDFYQITPKIILSCFRNYYAAYLAQNTSLSNIDIALICRFQDVSLLYKFFKRHTGITWTKYLKQNHWHEYPHIYKKNKTCI